MYTLSHIGDVLNSIHGPCWFIQLEIAAGYHQICISAGNRQKTTFITTCHVNMLRVLLFVLRNAPSQFLCRIDGIMEPMKCTLIIVLLDTIRINNHTLVGHVIHVQDMLAVLREHGLKAKCAK